MGIRSKWLIFVLIIALSAGAVIIFKRGEKLWPVDTPVADPAALMAEFDNAAEFSDISAITTIERDKLIIIMRMRFIHHEKRLGKE